MVSNAAVIRWRLDITLYGREEPVTDRAFWISWYDLPEECRSEVLAWTHDVYVPRVLARPGVLWAAHYASETKFTPLGCPRSC